MSLQSLMAWNVGYTDLTLDGGSMANAGLQQTVEFAWLILIDAYAGLCALSIIKNFNHMDDAK